MTAASFYSESLEQHQQEFDRRQKRKSALGILRFGSIVAIVLIFYFLWSIGWLYVLTASVILIFIFTRLVFADLANKKAMDQLSRLVNINKRELLALDGQYYQFENGQELLPKEHDYAADLDILGHASIFQFLNRTTSEMGSRRLASWLLSPATPGEISERQTAIKELSVKAPWRQQLEAFGREKMISIRLMERLNNWMHEPTSFLQFKPWAWLRYLLPSIILTISLLTYLDYLGMQIFYGSLLFYSIIAYQVNKIVSPIHEQLSKMLGELESLGDRIGAIENEKFDTALLLQLQSAFSTDDSKASRELKRLKKILDRLDLRYNIVLSFPLNIFLLWNLQQVLDLEKWKTVNPGTVTEWFEILGIFEAMNSFAGLHFNHPEWVFPVFAEPDFQFEANGLGHPLIPAAKRVDNYIRIDKSGEIMLVTGSNMAGKSTYLRSVGVNIVLAMAGAPVCSKTFRISPVHLISSMRIADNLEESTSTFYAELKKLKTVISKVNQHEKVFILLDEILRGTNSIDRHAGSVALVKQLIKKDASAILATHDVELASLSAIYPQNILNYHFDVHVDANELFFDYKLKPGVCSNMNASILMKQIGIEMDGTE